MSRDKSKKGGYGLRNIPDCDCEKEKEATADEASLASGQDGDRGAGLDWLQGAVGSVLMAEKATLQAELKGDFKEFRTEFREDIKKQMDELSKQINQRLLETTDQVEEVTGWLKQVEENIADAECCNIGVKDTLVQLLENQWALQEKVSYMEGRARRKNIRIYGVPENSEGSSVTTFVENLIKDWLGKDFGPDRALGIKRAHCALGPKPPPNAPPCSIIVCFLRFAVKEEILHAAWYKGVHIQDRRVYFDHDYSVEVKKRRREYIPVKKALKDSGIRFQTPLSKMRVLCVRQCPAEDLRKWGIAVGKIT
ncbi:unnamed protein product [Oreochromis niloticus]|nr:unnamed protein product [Mustela putorius furo]